MEVVDRGGRRVLEARIAALLHALVMEPGKNARLADHRRRRAPLKGAKAHSCISSNLLDLKKTMAIILKRIILLYLQNGPGSWPAG